ncbi:hypothetical protein Goarm_016854 [Gossypium armourianum]|nr:hypothetical protein [Gossypium armourianum]
MVLQTLLHQLLLETLH